VAKTLGENGENRGALGKSVVKQNRTTIIPFGWKKKKVHKSDVVSKKKRTEGKREKKKHLRSGKKKGLPFLSEKNGKGGRQ